MEADSNAEDLEARQAARNGLDKLNGGVVSLADGIADVMRYVVEQFCAVGLEHARHRLDGLQAAADGRGHTSLRPKQPMLPKAIETLFVETRPAGLQTNMMQQTEDGGLAPL